MLPKGVDTGAIEYIAIEYNYDYPFMSLLRLNNAFRDIGIEVKDVDVIGNKAVLLLVKGSKRKEIEIVDGEFIMFCKSDAYFAIVKADIQSMATI